MRRPTATELGYALLFSVPAGLGGTAFAVNLAGMAPGTLLFGVGLTLGVFLLCLAGVASGAPADPEAGREAS